ncbi:fumarylacetoacetate hydrolase family protein [Martelella radicis]|uniref:Fumarylacetoacetate (FAA) hydrolase family protein n=1 Tax=Martelella radicis TaxID=1397476 RepID=A0A7W6KJT7_9HYPH|nr:fumarylacetoacetate hydrolase family protein [Martelella radicis]MBB4122639.1 fumarylacetoacetate (FAA) hydrolase family protein [Martelella radicis]
MTHFDLDENGIWLGRVWLPEVEGPAVVTCRNGRVIDISARGGATVSDICEMEDPAAYVEEAPGRDLGALADLLAADPGSRTAVHFLAPNDLQAIKACGVTFARSMVERVIEEQAAGDPKRAETIRARIGTLIGDSLRNIKAGSEEAQKVKAALQAEGLWSQYLEVGIGPDAEVFSKSQPMSAVGYGAEVGILQISQWNNPEPEVVLLVNSRGEILGATLGNDVNLRDVEGRSALLLGKAKDNNASCALGPMFRLFGKGFGMDDVRAMQLGLRVDGPEGYVLHGQSSMAEISRDPADLVRQTVGAHHQYPDGFILFLGTLFAPTEDRDVPGEGFTHKTGDRVTISNPALGALSNTVRYASDCAPWIFGTGALMKNLAARNLL